jgi:hypothetical protein
VDVEPEIRRPARKQKQQLSRRKPRALFRTRTGDPLLTIRRWLRCCRIRRSRASLPTHPGVLRKTQREVYRWIANTHYEHLADAVLHLERVHAAGCTFGSLLSTRDREQFVSLTAEVLVADDFLRRGYEVQTVQRSDQVSPDLLVVVDGLDVAVEVYSPRELLAVDAWVKEVSDLLNYVDVKASYASSVRRSLSNRSRRTGRRSTRGRTRRCLTRRAEQC